MSESEAGSQADERSRRRRIALASAFAVVAGLVFIGGVAAIIVHYVNQQVDDPDPRIVDEWTGYPGTAWGDPDDALDGASYEGALDDMEALTDELRSELTASRGIEWTEIGEGYDERSVNGYDGESLLRDVATPTFQGSASAADPEARQEITDLFHELAAQLGMEAHLRNDVDSDDQQLARRDFGGTAVPEQPLWSAGALGADGTVACALDVLDRAMPADAAFAGDWAFDYGVAGDDTLLVTVSCYGYELLPETDRQAFIEALEPFEGQQKPDAR